MQILCVCSEVKDEEFRRQVSCESGGWNDVVFPLVDVSKTTHDFVHHGGLADDTLRFQRLKGTTELTPLL